MFALEGKQLVLAEITERLRIIPTNTRTPDDWPDIIKNPKTELPEEFKTRYIWLFDTGSEPCYFVVRDLVLY